MWQVRFYANRGEKYKDKLFSFRVASELEAFALLLKFVAKGNFIKAAFLGYPGNKKESIKLDSETLGQINRFDLNFLKGLL